MTRERESWGGRVPGRAQGGRVQRGSQGVAGRECMGEGQGGGREPGWARKGACKGGPGRREGARVGHRGKVQGRAMGEGGSQGVAGREAGNQVALYTPSSHLL
jgi:hypothetical protein